MDEASKKIVVWGITLAPLLLGFLDYFKLRVFLLSESETTPEMVHAGWTALGFTLLFSILLAINVRLLFHKAERAFGERTYKLVAVLCFAFPLYSFFSKESMAFATEGWQGLFKHPMLYALLVALVLHVILYIKYRDGLLN